MHHHSKCLRAPSAKTKIPKLGISGEKNKKKHMENEKQFKVGKEAKKGWKVIKREGEQEISENEKITL